MLQGRDMSSLGRRALSLALRALALEALAEFGPKLHFGSLDLGDVPQGPGPNLGKGAVPPDRDVGPGGPDVGKGKVGSDPGDLALADRDRRPGRDAGLYRIRLADRRLSVVRLSHRRDPLLGDRADVYELH